MTHKNNNKKLILSLKRRRCRRSEVPRYFKESKNLVLKTKNSAITIACFTKQLT